MASKVLFELPSVLTVTIPVALVTLILYQSALVLNMPQPLASGVLVPEPFVLVIKIGVPGVTQIPHGGTGGELPPSKPHGLDTVMFMLTSSSLSGSTTSSKQLP